MPGSLFGERSLTLVAALYGDAVTAGRAAKAAETLAANDDPIDLVGPHERRLVDKMEPDEAGIWHTALRSHAALGAMFALIGAVAGAWLIRAWPAAAAAPGLAVVTLAVFGMFAGLLLAGLLTLRPDRAWVIRRVREAAAAGRWAVIAHPRDEAEADLVGRVLQRAGGELVRSL